MKSKISKNKYLNLNLIWYSKDSNTYLRAKDLPKTKQIFNLKHIFIDVPNQLLKYTFHIQFNNRYY